MQHKNIAKIAQSNIYCLHCAISFCCPFSFLHSHTPFVKCFLLWFAISSRTVCPYINAYIQKHIPTLALVFLSWTDI